LERRTSHGRRLRYSGEMTDSDMNLTIPSIHNVGVYHPNYLYHDRRIGKRLPGALHAELTHDLDGFAAADVETSAGAIRSTTATFQSLYHQHVILTGAASSSKQPSHCVR
jgi:hypothetical protein